MLRNILKWFRSVVRWIIGEPPPAASNTSQPDPESHRGNGPLKIILFLLMLFVFLATTGLMYGVLTAPMPASGATLTATPTPPAGATPTSAATPLPSTTPSPSTGASPSSSVAPQPGTLSSPPAPGSFGVFDTNQAGSLPTYAKYLIASMILVTGAVLEMFLIILYAAFFVNDPANSQLPLGLPQSTVRVFLVGIIVLVIIIFAFLPEIWGGNRAVVLLFGLLSTVIGFYFGSRTAADSASGGGSALVRLTLDADPKKQNKAAPKPVTGTLDANYRATLGVTSLTLNAVLLDNSGVPVVNSQDVAIVDRDGNVQFDFSAALRAAATGSYFVHVISPAAVVCDERITLDV